MHIVSWYWSSYSICVCLTFVLCYVVFCCVHLSICTSLCHTPYCVATCSTWLRATQRAQQWRTAKDCCLCTIQVIYFPCFISLCTFISCLLLVVIVITIATIIRTILKASLGPSKPCHHHRQHCKIIINININIAFHLPLVLYPHPLGTRRDKSVLVQEYILANTPEGGEANSSSGGNTIMKMSSMLGMGGGSSGKANKFKFWK